jgi:hypothetical protein
VTPRVIVAFLVLCSAKKVRLQRQSPNSFIALAINRNSLKACWQNWNVDSGVELMRIKGKQGSNSEKWPFL